eukprot:m.189549 g.189549  ORF g.189549 m.189549 type:complete len:665 (-) comp32377_c2_seq2:273-2267(-)
MKLWARLVLVVVVVISTLAIVSKFQTGNSPSNLYQRGASAVENAAIGAYNGALGVAEESDRLRREAIELQASRQEEANKVLKEVNAKIISRRKELVEEDSKLMEVRARRAKAEEQVEVANFALRNLKKNVSALGGENAKMIAKRNRLNKIDEAKRDEISQEETKKLVDESFKKFAFNEYQSSLLPIDREIPDTRIDECKAIMWDIKSMLKHSVIVCFVNEAWSTLLRTIMSVINRTPIALLTEIILVDDCSDAEWLGGPNVPRVREYVSNHFATNEIKFKIISAPKRLGLIRARLLGATNAVGPVLTFLDSHVEANLAWSEPILDIITKDHSAVVTPVIDTISNKDMSHASWKQQIPAVGTFSWTLDFTWKGGKLKPGQVKTDAIDSPTMAGGLFSIHKQYFKDIGTYDEHMDGWGGENIEISFRIWQCGGRLVTAPCSHVGHIFRDTHPYTIPGSSIHETFMKNSARLAEVWMDDYKKYFYQSRVQSKMPDLGDLTSRKDLRKKLKCKSFQWYLDTLVPDMFIPDEKHIKFMGAVRNGDKQQCLDKMGERAGGKAGVYFCHSQGGNQAWMYTTKSEVRSNDDLCLDAWGDKLPADVHLQKCHGGGGNQQWNFEDGMFKKSGSEHCLGAYTPADNGAKKLGMVKCDSADEGQKWTWETTKVPQS